MTTRIYLVAACIAGIAQAPRLIEAGTAAAARNHATRDMLTVKPATPKEVAALVKSGTALEIANEAPIEQQQLPGTGDDDGTTGGAGLGSTPELPDAGLMQSAAVPGHWSANGEPLPGNPLLDQPDGADNSTDRPAAADSSAADKPWPFEGAKKRDRRKVAA